MIITGLMTNYGSVTTARHAHDLGGVADVVSTDEVLTQIRVTWTNATPSAAGGVARYVVGPSGGGAPPNA